MPEHSPSAPIRILIVDDHALLRNALAHDLQKEADFVVAGSCGSVNEALEVIGRQPVDVVLLDLDLGKENGNRFVRLAAGSGFQGKVVVVTIGLHPWEATRLNRDGVFAIFLKEDSDLALFRIIREAAASPPMAWPVPTAIGASTGPLHRPLTERQTKVLRMIVEGKANKQIAASLDIRETQVKEALQGLFLRCGVRTRAQLVRVALERYWEELSTVQDG